MAEQVDQTTFREEVSGPRSPDLALAALLFAREIAYPEMQPSRYLQRLSAWGVAAASRCDPYAPVLVRAKSLARFLFQEMGLCGNEEAYYDPRNSYLNEVLDRGLGLPISLSAIFLDIAARIDLPAEGVALPGHFIVAVRDNSMRYFLDPFHGGVVLALEDVEDLLERVAGPSLRLKSTMLAPASVDAVLARMLLNLRNAYIQTEQWSPALATVRCLRVLQPMVADHVRDMGMLHFRAGSLRASVEALEEYLMRAPGAPDASQVRDSLQALSLQLSRLN